MKTKKILAIVVSCLLLIGVAAGITASAAEAPTVAVSEVNLSYEGAIRLLYTFDTENLAAGQTVKAVFSANADTKVADGKFDASAYDYVGTAFNMNGATAVYSGGISPTAMTAPIYVIPVVTDSADNVVAVGEKVCFSIYDYCMARLGGEYTPEQYLLYLATLNFGGSIQKGQTALGAEKPANGYADEYYILSVMNGDGSVTEYKYDEPTDISLKAPKGYNGKLFDSFVDNKGVKYEDADFNIYNFKLDKIGTTYIKYVYGDTEISMDSVKATAGNSASLANANADVFVSGGTEYYLEADVTLADGTVAALDFMANDTAKIGTIYLTEADGAVNVTDGVTSFTMANGATLKLEYVVISTTENTGAIFYYVNNKFVAKTDVANVEGTSNASFASVVASATSGEIALDFASAGAKDGFVTLTTKSGVSTIVYDYDPAVGKYFRYKKTNDNADGGNFVFDLEGIPSTTVTTTLEAKVKLDGNFIATGAWRNAINVILQTQYYDSKPGRYTVFNQNVAFTPNAFHYGGASDGGTQYTIPGGIAANEWFDLKIEHVASKSFTIYINGEVIYTASNGTSATEIMTLVPSSGGAGSIYMADIKYTQK